MGGYVPNASLSLGTGTFVLSLPDMHGMRRQGTAADFPRRIRLSEKRAAVFHHFHRRFVFVHCSVGAFNAPVPRIDGYVRQIARQLALGTRLLRLRENRGHSAFESAPAVDTNLTVLVCDSLFVF